MLSFNDLKKNVKKDFSLLGKIKVAILADSASQLLNIAIKGHGYEVGLDFELYEADYNQIGLQIFEQSSELYTFDPEFVFINISTERLLNNFYTIGLHQQREFAEQVLRDTQKRYEAISSRLHAKVIINTFPEINDSIFGNYAAKVSNSFIYQIRKANVLLMELSQKANGLFVCDLASLQSEHGYQFVFDPRTYVTMDMVYSISFLPYIAKHITDIILSISGTFNKCLVLDLDNTVWGGIIGDDGMEGIQVGDLGAGKVFTELQLWAKQLKQRGIILAICSKNIEEIAKEPFLDHPDMVLRMDHIAVFVANWETKVDNIRYIQSILNIGFDSMVFLDDNPVEREMVKSAIPGIQVPNMPEDPAEYMPYLRGLNLFETASFTEEDDLRTKQYQEETRRTAVQQTFDNENDFLISLQMVSEATAFNEFTIPRVAQLTQRSNQFNLRTVRYTEEDIKRITANAGYYTISLTLEDRFSDHGLIAVIVLRKGNNRTLFVDTWIMSCRVLKRSMESFTMNTIIDLARESGYETIAGEYIPTKKNSIVKDHYQRMGFEAVDDKWIMQVAKYEKRDTFITNKK